MTVVRTPKLSFSSGEVAPVVGSAIETKDYQAGLKKCENYMVDVVGGIKNRPGTEYIADAEDPTEKSRFITFQFNEEQAYVIEFSDLKFRVLKDGALVGAPTVVVTQYTLVQIQDLEFTQSADTLYIFHPEHPIGIIERTSDTAWTLNAGVPIINKYPYKPRELNDENTVVNAKYISSELLGDHYDLEANNDIFADSVVGDPVRLGFPVAGDDASLHFWDFQILTLTSDSKVHVNSGIVEDLDPITYQEISNPDFLNGLTSWEEKSAVADVGSVSYSLANETAVMTDPSGAGTAIMQQAVITLPNTQHIIKVVTSGYTGSSPTVTLNIGTTSLASDILTQVLATGTTYRFNVLPTSETIYISFDTTGSTDADVVEINTVKFYRSEKKVGTAFEMSTNEWYNSMWNTTLGFPSVGSMLGERLITGNSPSYPQTLWASELGAFTSNRFSTPTRGSDAFSFSPPTTERNGIRWMIDKGGLKVGTAGAVWKVFAPSGGAISPLDIAIEVDEAEGSLDLKPIVAHNAILMTPVGKTPVLEMVSSLESQGFASRDLGTIANHLFKNRRIVRWAFAKDPDSVVWVILDNGQLLGFTYHRRLDRWAWHRHTCPLGAGYADVVVIPNSSDDNIDDVYFLINRGTVDSPNYYLEIQSARITPQEAAYGLSASGSPYDYRMLDSAITHDDPKLITNITTASPLVVTSTSHGFSDGDSIRIQNVVGMTPLNNNVYLIANKNPNDYELTDLLGNPISSVGWSNYVSGGESREMVTAISGLDHLEGSVVTAIADGAAREALTVSSGAVTLPISASFVHVGLPYTSEAELLDIEAIFQSGGTQGRKKSIVALDIYFLESRECFVYTSNRPDTVREVEFENESFGEEPPPLFDGVKSVDVKSDPANDVRVVIKQDRPYPQHIGRVIVDVDYTG